MCIIKLAMRVLNFFPNMREKEKGYIHTYIQIYPINIPPSPPSLFHLFNVCINNGTEALLSGYK